MTHAGQCEHTSDTCCVQAMSPDGESIVTGAGDETLRFWNVFNKTRSTKVCFTSAPLLLLLYHIQIESWLLSSNICDMSVILQI